MTDKPVNQNILAQEVEFYLKENERPVVITGMMGVGKSYLGRKLSDLLRVPFHDSDKIVEARAGMPVKDIFESFGEIKFREAEKNVVLELLAAGAAVIATGGGSLMNASTAMAVKEKAVSVWLKATPEKLYDRLKASGGKRPLLKGDDLRGVIKNLSDQREALYRGADIHVDSIDGDVEETLARVLKGLHMHIKQITL